MSERLIPEPGTAAIRCYGQGLGDCFLLAFARDGDPHYVVIDCGIAKGTPDEVDRMRRVVADIQDATGGRVDTLVVTHQHYDHVIGFFHAKDLWESITVGQILLPWTDKPGDQEATDIGNEALRLGQAAHLAADRALWSAERASQLGLRLADGSLEAGGETFGIGARQGIEQGFKVALDRNRNDRVFCEPGDVLPIEGTGVRAFVLGPPRARNRRGEPLLSRTGTPLLRVLEDRRAMYSYADIGMPADGSVGTHDGELVADSTRSLAFVDSLLGLEADRPNDDTCPFDRTFQVGWDEALRQPFFQEHYAVEDWRRIDDDWLDDTADLALRAGGLTNNLSLVLAFELPASKRVLLFVGDAQVGNWLSWHQIGDWRTPDGQLIGPADAVDLLGRTAFYKVGHHGSHNATIREQGLERMPDDLVAFVPVSVPVAHDIMGYCPMPFYPILRALQRKTRGAVYFANGEILRPIPDDRTRAEFESQLGPAVTVSRAASTLPAKVLARTGEAIEGAVPLWVEFRFDDRP